MSRQLTSGVLGSRRREKKVWLYKGEVWEYEEVINPLTGRTWMDRNLGANRVATAGNDTEAYGDLFQWGRLDDLHQNRNSLTTFNLSDSDVPDNDGKYIRSSELPFDWRVPQNDDLWKNGLNVPAPTGWRVPTFAELEEERSSWTADSNAGAFGSPLKFPRAGTRNGAGTLIGVGTTVFIWSSDISGEVSRGIRVGEPATSYQRVFGMTVRLIKEQ